MMTNIKANTKITLVVALASLVLSGFVASTAQASATWTVTTTTGDGSPLTGVTPGTTLTFDVTLTMSAAGEMLGISGSVSDWDGSLAVANAGASTVPSEVLFAGPCVPTFGCFNGVTNLESGLRVEDGVEGPGLEATFLSILSVTGTGGTGALDNDGAPGPQFQIVMDIPMGVSGSTSFFIGTNTAYADAFTGVSDSIVNNVTVPITVPEPGSVAASLAGLASVAGVIAVRRRQD